MVADQPHIGTHLDIAKDGAGVALWFEPGVRAKSEGFVQQLLLAPRFLALSGAHRLMRALAVGRLLDGFRPREPHVYLQILGCAPQSQGQGLGSALLRHRLAEIDRAGQAVFLETANPSNLPLYERFGFVSQGKDRPAANGPWVWPMWRAARHT